MSAKLNKYSSLSEKYAYGENLNTNDDDVWIRPNDWLLMPERSNSFQGLVHISPSGTFNSIALRIVTSSAGGSYYIDWGNGTASPNVSTNTVASTTYTYSSISSSTQTSYGYRQVIITASANSGSITALSLNQRPGDLPTTTTTFRGMWKDLWFDTPGLTGASVGNITQAQSLQSLERIEFNRHNITNMFRMFYYCNSLQDVIISNASIVNTWEQAFNFCLSLKIAPDLELNTSSAINLSSMFQNCYSLKQPPILNTACATFMNNMFQACYSLKSAPNYNYSKNTIMSNFFNSCYSLKYIPTIIAPCATSFNQFAVNCYSLKKVEDIYAPLNTDIGTMFQNCQSLKSIGTLTFSDNLTSMIGFLNLCYNLEEFPVITSSLSQVNNSYSFISNCWKIKKLPYDVNGNVTSFGTIFMSNNFALEEITKMTFPVMRDVSIAQWTSAFNGGALKYANVFLPKVTTTFANNKLDATEINRIFTNLPNIVGTISTTASGNGTSTYTYITSSAHGFIVGTNVNTAGFASAVFNGLRTIVSVPASNTFTTSGSLTATGSFTGGTASVASQTITVTGNPGAATCTASIATSKGWTVTV